jgi:hypothetical protein
VGGFFFFFLGGGGGRRAWDHSFDLMTRFCPAGQCPRSNEDATEPVQVVREVIGSVPNISVTSFLLHRACNSKAEIPLHLSDLA